MSKTKKSVIHIDGVTGVLPIQKDDKLSLQLAMLLEGQCFGTGPINAARKYGYSKQRYFQLLHAFELGGSAALIPKKTGPKSNHVRTENTVTEILRHRFLDPEANAEVIAQKMRQTGIRISTRSVQRTIADYGLQKKTLRISTSGEKTHS